MFTETIIAVFLLGALFGVLFYELLWVDPVREENAALRTRLWERQWADEEEARNLARYRKHLGTPYRLETRLAALPPDLADAIESVVDDHNGSRRALEAVQ